MANLTLNDVKNHLRIDLEYKSEDDYLNLLVDTAREYIIEAVGECDEEKARVKIVMLSIITNLYDTRDITNKDEEKNRRVINSIIMQLQIGDNK